MSQQPQWFQQPPPQLTSYGGIPAQHSPMPQQPPQAPHFRSWHIVLGIVIFVVILGAIGAWFYLQLPPPSSWLAVDTKSVIFIQWADNNGALSGQMHYVSLDSTNHLSQDNEPFTGTYSNQDHSISLTFHVLNIFTTTLTGSLTGNTLTLEASSSNGEISTAVLHPGSVNDFNQAVSNLQHQEQVQAQQTQNAEATNVAVQSTQEALTQQQQAVTAANNALSSALQQLKSDETSLKSDTVFTDVMQGYAKDWKQMQADYQQEQTDASNGCSQYYTVQSDYYTVQSESYSIQSDDYSLQSQQYPINSELSQVQNDIQTVQTDWQQLQNAVNANTTGSPAPAFSVNDVNTAVQAAQSQVNDSQAALKQAQSQEATYDNESKQLLQKADALVSNMKC